DASRSSVVVLRAALRGRLPALESAPRRGTGPATVARGRRRPVWTGLVRDHGRLLVPVPFQARGLSVARLPGSRDLPRLCCRAMVLGPAASRPDAARARLPPHPAPPADRLARF